MIAALSGALTLVQTKAFEWAAIVLGIVGGVLGFALLERRAGAQVIKTANLEREVADREKAAGVAAKVAPMTGSTARDALDKGFSR